MIQIQVRYNMVSSNLLNLANWYAPPSKPAKHIQMRI